MFDDLNRATYCCVKVGPHFLPVYHPGTMMFSSAMKFGSPLNIRNQNCLALENMAAFLLSIFMCHISGTYNELCKVGG